MIIRRSKLSKAEQREKKKRPKMKVSGRSVFTLQKVKRAKILDIVPK